jgi:DNA end-binding protein Ku
MIRETVREMDKVAIGRVVLTNREHIIALEANGQGLVGTLLRDPYEVRDPKNTLKRSKRSKSPRICSISPKHIVDQKSGRLEPDKFEDQCETALIDPSARSVPASRSRRRRSPRLSTSST